MNRALLDVTLSPPSPFSTLCLSNLLLILFQIHRFKCILVLELSRKIVKFALAIAYTSNLVVVNVLFLSTDGLTSESNYLWVRRQQVAQLVNLFCVYDESSGLTALLALTANLSVLSRIVTQLAM
jgi:hypothetical protein